MQAVFYGVGVTVISITAISVYKLTTKTIGLVLRIGANPRGDSRGIPKLQGAQILRDLPHGQWYSEFKLNGLVSFIWPECRRAKWNTLPDSGQNSSLRNLA